MYLTVRCDYNANWSALFMTGGNLGPLRGAEFQGTYLFPGSNGYDGQFYRAIAHDPGLQRGLFLDSPRLRYRRILLPALAWVVAFGNPWLVDAAYIMAVLGFVFLGGYGMARWAVLHGRHPGWGLACLALPATFVSINRMTTDVALAAFCPLWALWAREEVGGGKWYSLLVLMPFARETGLVLNGAVALAEAGARRFRRSVLALATMVPFGAWCVVVNLRCRPDVVDWTGYPLAAHILGVLWTGLPEPADIPLRPVVVALDYLALCGIMLAVAFAAMWWWRERSDRLAVAALLFALLAVVPWPPQVWAHVFAFGRVLSPLLLLLGMRGVAAHRPWLLVPWCLTLPRVIAESAPLMLRILRGLSK